MVHYNHYMPPSGSALVQAESTVLCGMRVHPLADSTAYEKEHYRCFFTDNIAQVTCRVCLAAYAEAHPEAYAAMEAKKAADNAPPARRKGRTDPGHDYSRHDPKGWCGDRRRGAAMGRGSYKPADPARWEGKLYVSREYLDNGGYDRNGTYYGSSTPLFWVRDAEYGVDYMISARDRRTALGVVAKEFPRATFVRGLNKADTAKTNTLMEDCR